jgi:hypothetical protein
MTYFYTSGGYQKGGTETNTEDTKEFLEYVTQKKHWRITQLANGFYQAEYQKKGTIDENVWIDITRRETLEGCEKAIDATIEHYRKKLEFLDGPKVVKTFS